MSRFDGTQLRRLMVSRRQTLAVAESITTGNIQAAIGAASGASDFYQGGITTYNIEQKVRLLNVDRDHAEAVNCVSARVAVEMAKAVASLFESDFGISSTGYAEGWPAGGIDTPFAYVAIWRRIRAGEGNVIYESRLDAEGKSRVEVQRYVTGEILSQLLRYLQNC